MNRLIIILISILLISCNKDVIENEQGIDYNFSITRVIQRSFNDWDSTIFYYDINKRLLQSERYRNPFSEASIFDVTYSDNSILHWDGTFIKDDNGKIIKMTNSNVQIDYLYNNGLLTHKIRSWDTITKDENFYYYVDSNVIKDSIINYDMNGEAYVTVYENIYSDTIVPKFFIDYSGLFEVPLKANKLVRYSVSNSSGIMDNYKYIITENCLIENRVIIDIANDQAFDSLTIKYFYVENK